MRNYIWAIIVLGFIYLAWKGLGFYNDEQRRKHEHLKLNDALENDSKEREKDRELQREILKNQHKGEGQPAPQ